MEKLHFHSPQIAKKGPNAGKQLDKIQLLRQEIAFSAKRSGYFPCYDAPTIASTQAAAYVDNIAFLPRQVRQWTGLAIGEKSERMVDRF